MMNVIVFEGQVRVCNLAGVCVMVKPGQMTTLRNGDTSSPVVTQATLSLLTDAINSTNLEASNGLQVAHHLTKGNIIAIGVLAVVPLVVIPIVASHSGSTTTAPPPVNGKLPCPPASANCG
jgi:hypothetical protein